MKQSHYKELKNFIHNEAKITKEEIREMIQVSVKNEVQKVVTPQRIDTKMNEVIQEWVKKGLDEGWYSTYKNRIGNTLEREIGKQVADRLIVDIKVES